MGWANVYGSVISSAGGAGQNSGGWLQGLFGGAQKSSGTQTEQLQISQEGINKIVSDLLGGEKGLASIFSDQNVAGLYNSTVSKQAAGNLLAQIAGEIAKVTAKKTTTQKTGTEQQGTAQDIQSGLKDLFSGKGTIKEHLAGYPAIGSGRSGFSES